MKNRQPNVIILKAPFFMIIFCRYCAYSLLLLTFGEFQSLRIKNWPDMASSPWEKASISVYFLDTVLTPVAG